MKTETLRPGYDIQGELQNILEMLQQVVSEGDDPVTDKAGILLDTMQGKISALYEFLEGLEEKGT